MHTTVRVLSWAMVLITIFISTPASATSVVQADQLVWSKRQFNDDQNKGRMTSVLSFAVTETDAVQIVGTCAAGLSGNFSILQIGASTEGMVDGRSVFVTLSTSSFQRSYKGTTIGSQAEFGISGVELRIDNDDVLWEALRRDNQLKYNVFGFTRTASLRGSSKPIGDFVKDCKFYSGRSTGSPAPKKSGNGSANTTGQNMSSVSHSNGMFVQTGGKRWQERGNDGGSFSFVEQGRDAWSVYLRDNSRGVNIQLDLHRKVIVYSDDKGQRFDLYQISKSGSKSTKKRASQGRKYSCKQEQTLRSKKGTVSTNIRFRVVGENDETQFKIYWLDYQGNRQFYKHVFAGQTYDQQTFLTHPWLVTAPEPGGGEICVAIYTPSKGGQTITLR